MSGGHRDHALLLAPAFPSLTALYVETIRFQHDLAAVLAALANRPFLRHISVAIGYEPVRDVWEQFLRQAGQRIKTAHLRELVRIPGDANEWIAMLLLHCTQLESLQLVMPHSLHETHQSLSSDPFTACPLNATLDSLARLHTLGLWGLQLDNQQVAAMLQHCPLLEDCTLMTPSMSAGMLSILGRRCPLLRRVWLEGQTDQLLGEMAARSLLTAVQASRADSASEAVSVWFAHLRVLYIDWTAGSYPTPSSTAYAPKFTNYVAPISQTPFPVSPRLIQMLPSLLAAAPLRYLHLPLLHDSSAQLLLFEPFLQLRGLSTLGVPSFSFSQCTERVPYTRQQQVEHEVGVDAEEQWWQKASDRGVESEDSMVRVWNCVFRDAVGSAGMDGRTAFFKKMRRQAELDSEMFERMRRQEAAFDSSDEEEERKENEEQEQEEAEEEENKPHRVWKKQKYN